MPVALPRSFNPLLMLLTTAALLLLLAACQKDPLGPENRMAMMALTQCRHDQALLLTDAALARGNEHNRLRALLVKAAILRDRGDAAAAEVLVPAIDAAWVESKRSQPTPARRERDIGLYLQVAQADRQARGIAPDCQGPLPGPATSQPAPSETMQPPAATAAEPSAPLPAPATHPATRPTGAPAATD